MSITSKIATYTLIGVAKKFQDFFYGDSADVTFEYMDEDETVKSSTVPNIKKIQENILVSGSIIEKVIEDDILKAGRTSTFNTRDGSYSVSLPENPDDGDVVMFLDVGRYAATNPLTILRNGKLIEDTDDDLLVDVDGRYDYLYYLEETGSWYFNVTGE